MKRIHNVHLTLLSVTCSSHDRGREGATVEERGEGGEREGGGKDESSKGDRRGGKGEGGEERGTFVGWLLNVPSTCQ